MKSSAVYQCKTVRNHTIEALLFLRYTTHRSAILQISLPFCPIMGNFVRSFWLLQALVVSFSSSALAVPASGTGPQPDPFPGTGTVTASITGSISVPSGIIPNNGTNGTIWHPPPSRTSGAPAHVQSEIYRYVKDCNTEQKARIETAWKDAKEIAIAHNKWVHFAGSLMSRTYADKVQQEPKGWFTSGKYQPAQDM
jgi:hypothetical protein